MAGEPTSRAPCRTPSRAVRDITASRSLRSPLWNRFTVATRSLAQRGQRMQHVGVKVSDKELAALPLTRHDFHGDWNYTLTPTTAQSNVR
ncbi:MAG: hypothetical protein ABR972_11775 [Acidimicrobiales bacterium]